MEIIRLGDENSKCFRAQRFPNMLQKCWKMKFVLYRCGDLWIFCKSMGKVDHVLAVLLGSKSCDVKSFCRTSLYGRVVKVYRDRLGLQKRRQVMPTIFGCLSDAQNWHLTEKGHPDDDFLYKYLRNMTFIYSCCSLGYLSLPFWLGGCPTSPKKVLKMRGFLQPLCCDENQMTSFVFFGTDKD